MPWTYHQRTGELWRNGKLIATGYSGHGIGKNNPDMQPTAAVGPIPRGRWNIDGVYNSKKVGPYALVLDPAPGTDDLGRSGFRVHGDSSAHPGEASNGCIIMPRSVRDDMWLFKDHIVDVVE